MLDLEPIKEPLRNRYHLSEEEETTKALVAEVERLRSVIYKADSCGDDFHMGDILHAEVRSWTA